MGQPMIEKMMRRAKVDALLFLSMENIRYLCGFTGSDGALIVTGQERIFLSDARYEEQAGGEIRNAVFNKYRQKMEGLAQLLKRLRIKRLGFESGAMTVEDYKKLQGKLPRVSFLPLAREMAPLRARKEPEELDKIRRAIRIASLSFTETLPRIRAGTREKAVAEFLECRMKRRGGDRVAFDTIVASGPRAALPHGAASDKRLQERETVVLDFGVRYQGYHSDETKTLLLSRPDAEQKKVYEIVRRAQEKALKTIRPGVGFRQIDAAARGVIARAGYGEFFGHGTGHGVGLAIHEPPTLSPRARGVAEEGMVFTVEPGIYIPGWGGVRLEDMIRVTERGCEKLTVLSKDLEDNILAHSP
jgi:Xaa-Pro aminopeptidase